MAGGGPATAAQAAQIAALSSTLNQLTQIARGLPPVPPGQPGSVAGGGGGSAYRAVEQQVQRLNLLPVTSGSAAIENVRRTAEARGERVSRLGAALNADVANTGRVDPIDRQGYEMEQNLYENTVGLYQLLQDYAPTIDAAEGEAVMRVLDDAQERGQFNSVHLGSVVSRIKGDAHELPESYMRTVDYAYGVMADLQAEANAAADAYGRELDRTGRSDPRLLANVKELAAQSEELSSTIRDNFDFALRDPEAAQADLESYLGLEPTAQSQSARTPAPPRRAPAPPAAREATRSAEPAARRTEEPVVRDTPRVTRRVEEERVEPVARPAAPRREEPTEPVARPVTPPAETSWWDSVVSWFTSKPEATDKPAAETTEKPVDESSPRSEDYYPMMI